MPAHVFLFSNESCTYVSYFCVFKQKNSVFFVSSPIRVSKVKVKVSTLFMLLKNRSGYCDTCQKWFIKFTFAVSKQGFTTIVISIYIRYDSYKEMVVPRYIKLECWNRVLKEPIPLRCWEGIFTLLPSQTYSPESKSWNERLRVSRKCL